MKEKKGHRNDLCGNKVLDDEPFCWCKTSSSHKKLMGGV